MTKKQIRSHKLLHAIKSYRGQQYSSGKWFRLPQLSKKADVERWAFRSKVAGDITQGEYDSIVRIEPLKIRKVELNEQGTTVIDSTVN